MIKLILRKIKDWSFSEEEKELFLNKRFKTTNKSDKIILIQCPKDLYWFEKIEEIAKCYRNHIIQGVVPKIRYPKTQYIIIYVIELIYKLNDLLLKRKWEKIYSNLEIVKFYGPSFLK